MAKRLIEHFEAQGFQLSLPESLKEQFLSLPGIGILNACQGGEKSDFINYSNEEWAQCPLIFFVLPKDEDNYKAHELFLERFDDGSTLFFPMELKGLGRQGILIAGAVLISVRKLRPTRGCGW